tara:strand:+ start:122 stop:958 length:837 start_codon:yes stop_codon:yes gene_type:complete
VIPAAGIGTRLLSVTKEMPKEMLPLFTKNFNGEICLKPIVQIVYEQLFRTGFREFCFIVGRGKRVIEDHFLPDYQYLERLKANGRKEAANDLMEFYKKIESSTLIWINQTEPKGFGDAVLQAKSFTNEEPFLVHAGDTYISSNGEKYLHQIIKTSKTKDVASTLCLLPVDNTKHYGVAEISGKKSPYIIKRVIEKPKNPPTNLAIMPVYMFTNKIYDALENIGLGQGGEIQLTDGIQKLIDENQKVVAFKLTRSLHLDIGTPKTYWNAQKISYNNLTK